MIVYIYYIITYYKLILALHEMKANQHPKMSRFKYQAILMCPIPHEMDGFLVEQCPLWP